MQELTLLGLLFGAVLVIFGAAAAAVVDVHTADKMVGPFSCGAILGGVFIFAGISMRAVDLAHANIGYGSACLFLGVGMGAFEVGSAAALIMLRKLIGSPIEKTGG